MASGDGCWLGRAPTVEREDKVGAGDSMAAGMLLRLSRDRPLEEAFRLGLAAGASAASNPGPVLCEPESFGRFPRLAEVLRL